MDRTDPNWWQDVGVLWQRPLEFFPTADQTPAERGNALTRFLLYFALSVLTMSLTWLLFSIATLCILAFASAAVATPPPRCMEPTPQNFSMNPRRWTIAGAGWQAGRVPACKYDARGTLARKVVAARDRALLPGADVSPWYTVPGATSLDPLTESLQFVYGDWHRPNCKVDQRVCKSGAQLDAVA